MATSLTKSKGGGKTKKNKKRTGGGGKAGQPAEPKSGKTLTKNKGPGQEPPKTIPWPDRAAKLTQRRDDAFAEVYNDPHDPGTDGVRDELAFDKDVVHELAELASESTAKVTKANIDQRTKDFDGRVQALRERVEESRRYAQDLDRLGQAAADIGVDPAANRYVKDAWASLKAELSKKDRMGPLGMSQLVGEVELRVGMLKDTLAALNAGRPPGARYAAIPDDLLNAVAAAAQPLPTLLRAARQLNDPAVLRDLFNDADHPDEVPALIREAALTGLNVTSVVRECIPPPAYPGGPQPYADTGLAARLIATVKASGKPASFFLTGEGGRRLQHLRYAAEAKAPLWNGATVAETDLHYGPEGGPAVTLAFIVARAEQAPPPGADLPPPPVGYDGQGRYCGGRPFDNNGAEQGMMLPRVTTTGALIQYREYDMRPFQFGVDRGGHRVVVGNDGRRYHTDDHYQTFKRIT
ncbi:ribonuclease domain-containing protein [Actinocrispum sp. NPDC049592]|uniref:ribonuclease domain-containing protein n=1 Tax=Actinocrispum sp. NPDC049592 TaxID=3154835 RepID=UPI00343AC0F9